MMLIGGSVAWAVSRSTPTTGEGGEEVPSSRLGYFMWISWWYMRFYGASTSEVIDDRNEWYLMIMMANDIQGWMGPKFSWQPGKLTRMGIVPGPARWEAALLPLDHSGARFCGGRIWVWVGFISGFFRFFLPQNFIPPFLHIQFVSFHFTRVRLCRLASLLFTDF